MTEPTKKAKAMAVAIAELNEPIEAEPDAVRRSLTVDYQSFLDAEAEDTDKGIDAEVVVPNFVMDENNHLVLAEDQSTALVLRLAPYLTANSLGVLASYRHGVGIMAIPIVFEALLHPDSVYAWRRRFGDPSNPVPTGWLVRALSAMMSEHGINPEEQPGKSGS